METFSYILFALALSVDSFGAGMAYGARQIRVPLTSLFVISLMSVAAICISMVAGHILLSFIPASLASRFGGALLLLLGTWILLQARQSGKQAEKDCDQKHLDPKMIEIRIRPLGLVIQILKEPTRADLDSSGAISCREAFFLGFALAMDAFGAGFAISILGFSIIITALAVGIGQFSLIHLGILAGRTITTGIMGRQLTALPGYLLILLGLFKMY